MSNFLILEDDHFICLVTSTMQVCKNLQCLILSDHSLRTKYVWTVLVNDCLPAPVHQITRTLGEDKHPETENDGGDHLQAPWDTEGSNTIDVGASELNEVLD